MEAFSIETTKSQSGVIPDAFSDNLELWYTTDDPKGDNGDEADEELSSPCQPSPHSPPNSPRELSPRSPRFLNVLANKQRRRSLLGDLVEPDFLSGIVHVASRRKSLDAVAAPVNSGSPFWDRTETGDIVVDSRRTSRPHVLSRSLSEFDLTLIGVGASVGSHIFVFVGNAAKHTGPGVALSVLLAAIGCTFCGLCYTELAARVPLSGSVYIYAYVSLGEFAAVICALNLIIDYHVAAAMSARSLAGFMSNVAKRVSAHNAAQTLLLHQGPSTVLAVLLATGVLCFGVQSAFRTINGFLVISKIVIIVIVIVVGFGKAESENLSPFLPNSYIPVIEMAATFSSFIYISFDVVASAAEECKDPSKDIPVGIGSSFLVTTILYTLISLAICGVVPFKVWKGLDINDSILKTPVAYAFGPKGVDVPFVASIADWGGMFGVVTALLVNLYCQARIYLSISRDGFFFKAFREIHPTWKTPIRAQLLCGTVVIILASWFPLITLSKLINIGVLICYSAVCAGVLCLRSKEPRPAALACAGVLLTTVICLGPIPVMLRYVTSSAGTMSAVYMVLAAVVCASWTPALQFTYDPPTTFSCPLVPYVPLLGLTVNGFLLAQLPIEVWWRFLATTCAVLAIYTYRMREYIKDTVRQTTTKAFSTMTTRAASRGRESIYARSFLSESLCE